MSGGEIMKESAYDFHLRAKHELYKSLIDGIDLENAAANFEFSKMNAQRHGLELDHFSERIFNEASDWILKDGRKKTNFAKPFRSPLAEKSGMAKSPWITTLRQYAGGHENPRASHSTWPEQTEANPEVAYGGISPWSLSPFMKNSEWGRPAWIDTLASSWIPYYDSEGNLTNHHKDWLIPEVEQHEKRHANSYHNQPSHLGRIDGEGPMANPQQLYSKHFYEWLQTQPKEVQDLDPMEQRDMHLNQYKRVWAGLESDPLDPYDSGSHALGFLGYALGLEWLKPSERDAVIQHISEHGFKSDKRMPFVNPGWLLRNWKGRYGGPELMHRLRSQTMPGSAIPSQNYNFENEKVKEAFKGRRLMEAMKDLHVYANDIPMAGLQAGQIPVGIFDDDGNFVHDPMHEESHFLVAQRQRKEELPHLISTRQASQLGVQSLQDYLLDMHGHIPRHVKDENGDLRLTLDNDIAPDNAFSSVEEFTDLLHHGYINENQYAYVMEYMAQVAEEFERHKQISNGIAPYINMYHQSSGDPDDVRMSPYAVFMAPHHAAGGHADDPTAPIAELHHMFHPDVWRENQQHGLFTTPTSPTPTQYIIPLKDGLSPAEQFNEKIWPKASGRLTQEGGFTGDEYREQGLEISMEKEGQPRNEMQNIVGFMSDLPMEAGSALPFHIMDGKIQSWPQLAISHDPQYHDDFSRAYPMGPLNIADNEAVAEEIARNEDDKRKHYGMTRNTLNHILNRSGSGRRDEKAQALLANLWGRWEEHPADAPDEHPLIGISQGNMVGAPNTWERELTRLAREQGGAVLPGHNHTEADIKTRVRQLMMHADIGREAAQLPAFPLLRPASESFAEELNPTRETTSPGMSPGETHLSDVETGWLDSDPDEWFLYQPTDELPESGPVDESMVRDLARKEHIEPIQTPDGQRPHRFSFRFRNDALQALADGHTDCPVCGGDGKLDPEDVKKSNLFDISRGDDGNDPSVPKPKSLFDYGGEESAEPDRPDCPNCGGTGKHIFTAKALQSRIMPAQGQVKSYQRAMGLDAFLQTPEDERDEDWYRQMEEFEDTPEAMSMTPMGQANKTQTQRNNYFASKYLSTVDLVGKVAGALAKRVREQFEKDGLPDPFGPDENGDYSQAHVNALALWAEANEWALRAQPKDREWENDHVHGVEVDDEETPNRFDRMQASSSIYFPHAKGLDSGDYQTQPGSMPLSLFNSAGYRMKYGWKMSPTFGISHSGMEGGIEVLHNNGMPSADKMPFLSVPMQQLRTVFPDLQPMSKTHPSAPSAEDIPEQQKMGQDGESVAFQLSEDDIPVSTLLKSLTDPDILKEKGTIKPIKPAHRIFSYDDMKQLRGFSGEWLVSSWWDGYRVLIHKQGKKVDARFADGTKARLSADMRKGLVAANDDRYVADAIIHKKEIVFIDLLEHGHKELYEEPLKDRIVRLRSQFESSEHVLMPAPFNTRRTDDEGLEQAIENIQAESNDGVLLRDAISTYMKGESRHPKWVLMRNKKDLDVIILNVRGSGPFMYQLGIGPINEEKAKSLGNRAVQHDNKWFMDVGTLSRERKPYVKGDYVRVSVSSITDKEREGEEVFEIQPIKIIGESQTPATDSAETLRILTKGYAPLIFPHDVIVKESTIEVHIPHIEDAVIYKTHKWGDHWMIDKPMSVVNDLSDSDYAVHMAESLRPFWQPIAGMTLNNLLKLDYDPRDTNEKGKGEKEEEEEDMVHEVAYEIRKPKKMGNDHILKPETTKMMTKALALIDTYLAKEASTWTGARGLGIGLGTPDSAPRGPTELTSDSNTLDYDMRERDEDDGDKPKKNRAKGEVQPKQELIETDEGETGQIRITEDEATLEIDLNPDMQ